MKPPTASSGSAPSPVSTGSNRSMRMAPTSRAGCHATDCRAVPSTRWPATRWAASGSAPIAASPRSNTRAASSTPSPSPMACRAWSSTAAPSPPCAAAASHSVARTASTCSHRNRSPRAATPRRSRSRGCRSGRANWQSRMRTASGWTQPTASSASNSPRSTMPRPSATASAIAWTDSTTTGSMRERATTRATPTSGRAPTPSTCGRATTMATGATTLRARSWRSSRPGGKPRSRVRSGCCSRASRSCCPGARGAGSGGRSSCTTST